MNAAKPHALTTYSGRQLDLDACTADEIFVGDIAAALSKICRFGAQSQVFYSVAQHAVLVRDILVEDLGRPNLALYGLHHDSHEAFTGDLPSPLKAKINEEGDDVYDRLCAQLDLAISEALGFMIPAKGSADYAVFKRADETALLLEARKLLHDRGTGVQQQLVRRGVVIADVESAARLLREPLTCGDAETSFLDAHDAAVAARLSPDRAGTSGGSGRYLRGHEPML